jgi:hypothetical protein
VGTIRHERTVHKLHFLVDGVAGSLWDNGLQVDAAPAPAGVKQLPLLSLQLTWAALQALLRPKQEQVQVEGAADELGTAYVVGDAMFELLRT